MVIYYFKAALVKVYYGNTAMGLVCQAPKLFYLFYSLWTRAYRMKIDLKINRNNIFVI